MRMWQVRMTATRMQNNVCKCKQTTYANHSVRDECDTYANARQLKEDPAKQSMYTYERM